MSLKHTIAKLRRALWAERLFRLRAFADDRYERLQHTLGHDKWDIDALRKRLRPSLIDGDAKHEEELDAALLDWMQRERSVRFFVEPKEQSQLIKEIERCFPHILHESVEEAEAVCRYQFQLFDATVRFDENIPWVSDPISRKPWPMAFYQQIDIFGARQEGIDIQYTCEFNRHQFLIPLAKTFWLTGELKYAEKCLQLVEDWIDSNPYKVGVNWTSALEVAFRSISWVWAYHFLLHSVALTPAIHQKWLIAICQHAEFLQRHLEFYSSPYNHLIGEATALFLIGTLFPLFWKAQRWQQAGWEVLCSEIDRQFYRDGGGVEQATFYHHATLGFYLLAYLLYQRNEGEWANGRIGESTNRATRNTQHAIRDTHHILKRIEKSLEYTLYMMRPDGSLPMIGDVDDGRSIRIGKPAFHWDFRDFLTIGAVLFNRGDMKERSGGFHENALWLMGLDGWKRYQQLEALPPKEVSVALRDSGYYLMRSGWDKEAHTLCFDCGKQADGLFTDATPSTVHGHADCLSIDVCVGGHPFLIDPGCYSYQGDPNWSDYFRKTRAHNTVEVDGQDQSRHLGTMDWCCAYKHQLESWITTPTFDYVSGSHDGYTHVKQGDKKKGVVHKRSVFFCRPDYWIIRDELLGTGEHDVACYFHLAPEILVRDSDGNRFELCHRGNLSGQFNGLLIQPLTPNFIGKLIATHDTHPDSGWVAPGYGQKQPAAILCFKKRIKAPAVWYTLLYPYSGESPNLHIHAVNSGWTIEADWFQDWVLVRQSDIPAPITDESMGLINQTRTDAEWTCIRQTEAGRIHLVCLIHGSHLNVSGQLVFQAEEEISYAVITIEEEKLTVQLAPETGYQIWQDREK
ncbi:alginate lyase family protein [Candidatus Poribacteria bacterium]|nr:alginate lyase family protein [Candidatus Poribacteria bacterium]